ncbi:ECF RNA polymerase sigma factor SigE [Anatilimnocola aggregata]|uniref:RNA polymerase sigma factor n=1 Tax=Anatilimnocola aggregata TaxID=2528021 RepID=A0A517Y8T8_9BACT|nr:sigma-70 family RNA polymerase sigma factor [Anatilimnocola aggregata]QDU26654.1 ECF RNA polymerase sigma factor SigE [Anatilimnocola aggregata]
MPLTQLISKARRIEPAVASDQEEERLRTVRCRRLTSLLAKCQERDPSAQRDLVLESQELVYRTVYRLVGRNDVDDVTQQVYLQVFRHIDQFKGLSTVATWLCRIAINESLQHIRRRSNRKVAVLAVDPQDFNPPRPADSDDRELLELAMSRIEPELKIVFVLREEEGLTYEQISEMLDLPEGTVASRINRARQQLKEHLTRLGWSPENQ